MVTMLLPLMKGIAAAVSTRELFGCLNGQSTAHRGRGYKKLESLLHRMADREDDMTRVHTYDFSVAVQRRETAESRSVKYCGATILAVLFAAVALSEDFKTTNGKVYKDATVSRIESDGIELRTKTGISKVYFTELPQDVQERFHWAKPEEPREPFYRSLAAAVEDPAVLAKIIAAGASIVASVALVINHIRSRRQPTIRARRPSRRKAIDRARL
jgi:hypothetical protein